MTPLIRTFKLGKIAFISLLLCLLPCFAFGKTVSKCNISVNYDDNPDGTINVVSLFNGSPQEAQVHIDSRVYTLAPNQTLSVNQKATKRVYGNFTASVDNGGRYIFWTFKPVAAQKPAEEAATAQESAPAATENKDEADDKPASSIATPVNKLPSRNSDKTISNRNYPAKNPVRNDDNGYMAALTKLDNDPYFGIEATDAFVEKTNQYAEALTKSKDKPQFIIDNDIEKYISDAESELKNQKAKIHEISIDYVVSSKIPDSATQSSLLSQVNEILKSRIEARQDAINALKAATDAPVQTGFVFSWDDLTIRYVIIGVAVLVILVIIVAASSSKKKKKKKDIKSTPAAEPQNYEYDPENPSIVVRRRTTSILKKQSLDDVIDNPEYLCINSADFAPDSAVRRIYVKNTCIKDVYNLYAEDLRNSANPKEDGCMVLGRWVHDEAAGVYDVSLEIVILPGDDAVFKEYELNFGGKIKLRVAERLRRLRRETNLQYDLVCWIHSHPGLGVFFSNSDNNVQTQLRHAQHPHFLTAFVVDILTSSQEMGIFTFRKDGVMNAKADLTKMYSLEEMYKWALESVKNSFSKDDYYNILGKAKSRTSLCKGIELNNNSIIDLTKVLETPTTGVAGWAIGAPVEVNGAREYAVTNVVRDSEKPTTGIIGIVLSVTHMSLPTIQRMVAALAETPAFVMVYSSKQNTVTAIPVIDGKVAIDENYYGEETIDDLKIWTRRKR